jgi:apolipoprotein N-acyltransferase
LSLPVVAGAKGRWLAAFAGALLPLTFAPFHAWFLAFPLFATLFFLWDGQTRREAAWRGFIFGFAAFATGTYWLYISVHVFGGAPVVVAVLLMLGLFWLMAMYCAVSGYLAILVEPRSLAWRWCVLWPAIFILFDWSRGWWFTGFPWLSAGYGQIDGPLMSWIPVAGVYGASFVTVVLSGVLLTMLRGGQRDRLIAGGIGLVVLASTWAIHDRAWTTALDQDLRVSLIQGSIPQDKKWLPEQRQPTLDLYERLTFSQPDPDLVIWPEVAVPTLKLVVQDYLDALDAKAKERGMQIYLGVLTYDSDAARYQNSLIGLGLHNAKYHKRHLVPFGEFFPVPQFVRQWMRGEGLPNQDTLPGSYDQPPLPMGDYLLSPSICYEDSFGEEQLDFVPAAHFLVNVSNDAWFGDSIAPDQHLQIARVRALEAGRVNLRATNTGITVVISPMGEILQRLPQFETGVLNAVVHPHVGATPYTRWGNIPVVAGCLVICLFGGYRALRRSGYPR